MGEPCELKFFGLRAGAAYFLTTDSITGGPHVHMEFYATRASVERRLRERTKQNLPVDEEQRALAALEDDENNAEN